MRKISNLIETAVLTVVLMLSLLWMASKVQSVQTDLPPVQNLVTISEVEQDAALIAKHAVANTPKGMDSRDFTALVFHRLAEESHLRRVAVGTNKNGSTNVCMAQLNTSLPAYQTAASWSVSKCVEAGVKHLASDYLRCDGSWDCAEGYYTGRKRR